MPLIKICHKIIDLPRVYIAGYEINEIEAEILQKEFIRLVCAKVRWRYDHKKNKSIKLQEEIDKEVSIFGEDRENQLDFGFSVDPILTEMINIAKENFIRSLEKDDISIPKDVDDRIMMIVKSSKDLREKAINRIKFKDTLLIDVIQKLIEEIDHD
jgi:hypothetical protein